MEQITYDLMKRAYAETSHDELVLEHINLANIECEDRCAANQHLAGGSFYYLNDFLELAVTLADLHSRNEDTSNCVATLVTKVEKAISVKNSILNTLLEMNDPSRVDKKLTELKKELEL